MKLRWFKKVNKKCFIVGHKFSETTDSGFYFCERCTAHEYYDRVYAEEYDGLNKFDFCLPHIWQYFRWWVKRKINITRCCDCHKITGICGIEIKGDHSDCLPF